MKKTINSKYLFAKVVVFLMVLFKYLEMWFYVTSGSYVKSIFILFVAVVAIFLALISAREKKNNLLLTIIVFLACLAISYLSSTINFLVAFSFAMVYFDKTENGIKRFIRDFLVISLFFFLITIVMFCFGILPEVVTVRSIGGEVMKRSSLGFFNANSVMLYLSPVIIAYLGLNLKARKKKKIIILILTLLITVILYSLTFSRTGLAVMIFSMILFMLSGVLDNKVVRLLGTYYLLIFIALSVFIATQFGKTVDNPVNKFLTNRPYLWNTGYVMGSNIGLTGSEITEGALDNSYMYLLYGGGLLSYLIYFVITKKSGKIISKNPELFFILLTTSVYGLTEQNLNYCINIAMTIQLYYCFDSNAKLSKVIKKRND